MGACASRSGATMAAAEPVHALTATVLGPDGSVARLAAPVAAAEALGTARWGAAASRFLCCADELDFGAPARALGARDALRAGQLYLALPLSMLGRPLSGQDMAALAVRASAALGPAHVVVSSPRGRSSGKRRRRRRQASGRVAPLVAVSGDADVERKHAAYGADRTVGKTRDGVGHRGVARRPASVQRLRVIMEEHSE